MPFSELHDIYCPVNSTHTIHYRTHNYYERYKNLKQSIWLLHSEESPRAFVILCGDDNMKEIMGLSCVLGEKNEAITSE